MKFRPEFDRLEAKPLMSLASPLAAAMQKDAAGGLVDRPSDDREAPAVKFVVSRITNPTPTNAQKVPPFVQVRVQTVTPRTGEIYNLNFVTVRNSTNRTFDANSGFQVKLSRGSLIVPIITGQQQWKPGQVWVFYILTKKFYPFSPQVSAGYAFSLAGTRSVAIPGPSGNYLRIKYDPATIEQTINRVVAFGPGAKGHLLGLPDTSLWEFTAQRVAGPRRGR